MKGGFRIKGGDGLRVYVHGLTECDSH